MILDTATNDPINEQVPFLTLDHSITTNANWQGRKFVPFKSFSTLTREQKLFCAYILDVLLKKAGIPARIQEFNSSLTNKGETSTFLKRMQHIAEKTMPLSDNMKKLKDKALYRKLKNLIEQTANMPIYFNKWKNEIEEDITVFKMTIPSSFDNYRSRLITIGTEYQKFHDLFISVQNELQKRLDEVTLPLKKFSFKSLRLICESHLTNEEYLEKNIQDYLKRTDKLNQLKDSLLEKSKEMENGKYEFAKSFNLLSYLVKFKCACTAFNEGVFHLRQSHYNYLSNLYENFSLSKNYIEVSDALLVIENEQSELIVYLFQLMLAKDLALSEDVKDVKVKGKFYKELKKYIDAWTPLENHLKEEEDALLVKEIQELIGFVEPIITIINEMKLPYNNYLEELKVRIPNNPPLFLCDLAKYREKTETPINQIAKTLDTIKVKIDKRIMADNKITISKKAKILLSLSHDTTLKKIEENFESFHKATEKIKANYVQLSNQVNVMSAVNISFQRRFSYISYLIKEKKLHTKIHKSCWFDTHYKLGYFDYFHDSKSNMLLSTHND